VNLIISSLATAAAANTNLPGDRYDEESNEAATPSESPTSKGSNQMDLEEGEDLGKHLDVFINQHKDNEEPTEGEILFGPGHTFF